MRSLLVVGMLALLISTSAFAGDLQPPRIPAADLSNLSSVDKSADDMPRIARDQTRPPKVQPNKQRMVLCGPECLWHHVCDDMTSTTCSFRAGADWCMYDAVPPPCFCWNGNWPIPGCE